MRCFPHSFCKTFIILLLGFHNGGVCCNHRNHERMRTPGRRNRARFAAAAVPNGSFQEVPQTHTAAGGCFDRSADQRFVLCFATTVGRGFFAPSFLVLSEYVASAWHTLNQFGGCKAGGVGVYHFVDRRTEKGSGKLAERPTSKVGRMPYSGGSLAADTGALWCQRTQLAGDRTVGGSPPNKADCCHSNRTAPEQFGTGYQAVWSGTHYGSQGPLPNDKRGEAPADGGGH